MLREDKRLIDKLHIGVTGGLFAAGYAILYPLMAGREPPLKPFLEYVPTIAILILIVMAALSGRELSMIGPLATPARLLKELALSCVLAALGYGFIAYTVKLPHLSRAYVYGGLLGGYALAAAWYGAASAWLRGRGRELRRVLLVGDPDRLAGAAATIKGRPALGLQAAGVVSLEGGLAKLIQALDSSVVDYAFFSGGQRNPALLRQAMLRCQERGVEVWFNLDLTQRELSLSRVDYLDDLPVLVFSLKPWPGAAIIVKRGLDIALSLALLAAFLPVLLLVASAVRLGSPGPVLFRQKRIGLNGREFTIYKFRSMFARPAAPAAMRNEMIGPVFKMKEDPRVTPLGRFMRRYSLDELPQLWNVLLGEMSLVGPRPPLPGEVERYKDWHRRRLSMRPGITGLWQVMGRNDIPDFNDWVKLDLRYLDRWSLWLDFKIMLKTIPVVLKGTGV